MDILAYKPGHDGAVALISDRELIFSIESEKNNQTRHATTGPQDFIETLTLTKRRPDIIALGGWSKGRDVYNEPIAAGYIGTDHKTIVSSKINIFGDRVNYFSSSHERSHIFGAYGMSPLPKGTPCYILVWEGALGNFYKVDSDFNISNLGSPMNEPGNRYAFIYGLADPIFSSTERYVRLADAGKLMALAAYSSRNDFTEEEEQLAQKILFDTPHLKPALKTELRDLPHYNVGLNDTEFRNFAGAFSNKIFDVFYQFIKPKLNEKLPLLISGGCGLNCDWNTQWRNTELFSEIFVAPVTNDSGSAIGTAVDAQFMHTGDPKIRWSVYSGLNFEEDIIPNSDDFDYYPISYSLVADLLVNNLVLAWAQGKYEIGPRALGNRSLLAAPFSKTMQHRLNVIKQREQFRPIAPICLMEDAATHFNCKFESPYMLYFQYVTTNKLAAVTHVNKTARIQTVVPSNNPKMHKLLTEFKKQTGFGVLCNTSLNFKGRGFLNKTSDLLKYITKHGIDGCIINDKCYLYKQSTFYKEYKQKAATKV